MTKYVQGCLLQATFNAFANSDIILHFSKFNEDGFEKSYGPVYGKRYMLVFMKSEDHNPYSLIKIFTFQKLLTFVRRSFCRDEEDVHLIRTYTVKKFVSQICLY